jgi:hypothetical protein
VAESAARHAVGIEKVIIRDAFCTGGIGGSALPAHLIADYGLYRPVKGRETPIHDPSALAAPRLRMTKLVAAQCHSTPPQIFNRAPLRIIDVPFAK